jgi:hypothetical protein
MEKVNISICIRPRERFSAIFFCDSFIKEYIIILWGSLFHKVFCETRTKLRDCRFKLWPTKVDCEDSSVCQPHPGHRPETLTTIYFYYFVVQNKKEEE